MQIKFLDLNKQYDSIKREIDETIRKVLDRQIFILGEELQRFEIKFAKYLGVKYAVGVSSGTDGLILALRALEISKGDEVITQVNSFVATTIAITEVGATPVFVDCDPDTYQLDVYQVRKKITKKTRSILPVHLYGLPCEIDELVKIAKENKLFIVEDACQAHGAEYKNKKVGTFGDIGVFSFYPSKNLGAYGDGGLITTNNEIVYRKLIMLRNYGQSKKYIHTTLGYNNRLDEIQAAVLSVKLKYLDRWNKKRNDIAVEYRKGLLYNQTQKIKNGYFSCYHLFVIESNRRDSLQIFLQSKGISTLIHYPIPIHLQLCFSFLGYKEGDFPVSERLAKRILSLPMYQELTKAEISYIVRQVNNFERKS